MRFVLDDAGEVCNIEYMNAPERKKRPPKDAGDEKKLVNLTKWSDVDNI